MREQIVACARSWLGTSFHHQGRLKKTLTHKGGVDCLGLLVGVAHELDLRLKDGSPFIEKDCANYSHYPDAQRLYVELASIMTLINSANMQTGDVMLLCVDDNPQHLAIYVRGDDKNNPAMIHAYAPARMVVEHVFDEYWQGKIAAAFSIISY
jgi:cell wall-associated NlpC family hydrolase